MHLRYIPPVAASYGQNREDRVGLSSHRMCLSCHAISVGWYVDSRSSCDWSIKQYHSFLSPAVTFEPSLWFCLNPSDVLVFLLISRFFNPLQSHQLALVVWFFSVFHRWLNHRLPRVKYYLKLSEHIHPSLIRLLKDVPIVQLSAK